MALLTTYAINIAMHINFGFNVADLGLVADERDEIRRASHDFDKDVHTFVDIIP